MHCVPPALHVSHVPHDCFDAVEHAPAEQLVASVSVEPEQLSAPHDTVGYVHAVALAVWHAPPQIPASAPVHFARVVPRGCSPAGIWVHVPRLPATSHAWQSLPHAEVQQ